MGKLVVLASLSLFILGSSRSWGAAVKKVVASPSSASKITSNLLSSFGKKLSKSEMGALKKYTLELNGKAVPALINVMKSEKFPVQNRWIATFLLGKVMGKEATPFIAKFSNHPNWIMRMASLKTLLALKAKKYSDIYQRALKDESMVVRTQALENIRSLGLSSLAPQVWKMMYDKRNYYLSEKIVKRTEIIKNVIAVVGELKYAKAREFLLRLIQKKAYHDIFPEMDLALSQLTGKGSPAGNLEAKRAFWKNI